MVLEAQKPYEVLAWIEDGVQSITGKGTLPEGPIPAALEVVVTATAADGGGGVKVSDGGTHNVIATGRGGITHREGVEVQTLTGGQRVCCGLSTG